MKIQNIFTITALFAVLLLSVSLASAAESNGVTVTVDVTTLNNVTQGETYDFTVTVANNNGTDLYFDFGISGWTWKDSTSSDVTARQLIANGASEDYTATLTIPSSGNKNVIVNAYETDTSAELFDVQQLITLNYADLGSDTTNLPEEVADCESIGSVVGDAELAIKIEDIKVKEGYGDDEDYWYPYDEIELEIEVSNKGDWDIESIEVHWGIWNTEEQDFIIDDEENDFNLDEDDDDETITVTFTLDKKIKKFAEGDNILYVWIENAKIDDNDAGAYDGDDIGAWDSYNADIVTDDEFVIITDLDFPKTINCGTEVPITFKVVNLGDEDQDEVRVIIYNKELNINKRIEVGDMSDFEDMEFSTLLNIPTSADKGLYYLEVSVYNDDNEIFETDEDEDKSKELIPVTIEGCGAVVSEEPTITATLLSDAKVGEEAVVQITVTNNGAKSENFVVSLQGTDTWAEVVDVSPQILTISQGSSKQATATLIPNKAGTQTFNIDLIYSGKEVSQTVSVTINEKAGFLTGAFSGFSDMGSTAIYVIAAVFLVLIIIILVLIAKVARRPKVAEF